MMMIIGMIVGALIMVVGVFIGAAIMMGSQDRNSIE